jgi:pilus assembly protein Flp/PilA
VRSGGVPISQLLGGQASMASSRQGQYPRRPDDEPKGGASYMLNFIREEEGQGLVEYALIIAVIAIAVIVAMLFLRGQIQNIFSNIGNNLT